MRKIWKFGGSSIATPERVKRVLAIIRDMSGDTLPGIVFSAFGGVTDSLIDMAHRSARNDITYTELYSTFKKHHLQAIKTLMGNNASVESMNRIQEYLEGLKDLLHGIYLVRECTPKTLDRVMSYGEMLSCRIITDALTISGIHAEFLDARPLVKTDRQFNSARVDLPATSKNISQYFKTHETLQIITGFIGSTDENETTTLGRGGSDYTASLFGYSLGVYEIEIWTDVDGIMTADPRKVKKAFPIEQMTYEEAMELCHFGAKVIHPPTMIPASGKKIPIRIRNTFHPNRSGTLVAPRSRSDRPVKGISSIDSISLLRIQGGGMIGVAGISHRLFGALARKNISVILISQASSEHSICVAVDPKDAEEAKKSIEDEFSLEIHTYQIDRVVIEWNLSIIAIVGQNMKKTPGISGRCFEALGRNGINVVAIAQGSSELNISVVINRENEVKALNALHEAFFLSDKKSMHLFLLGTGQIGSTLLEQIQENLSYLHQELALDIRLMAVGNLDFMHFDEDIDIKNWRGILEKERTPYDISLFISKMTRMNLPNSVFVDCTGSEQIVELYEEIFRSNISIVTPSKIANAGPLSRYRHFRDLATKHKVRFLYETTVGAGLPVISTLNDLLASGDRILKIEAVLSGTMSYIFNTLSEAKPFSLTVREAQRKGLCEPDPRDDLSGQDIVRKVLILAREAGWPFSERDVKIDSLLPPDLQTKGPVDRFLSDLERLDPSFEKRRVKAEKQGKRLVYMALIEKSGARISLAAFETVHPFTSLSGSDNMIVFTTQRYNERPLVIKGPGAGKEVTAGGVFADLVRLSHYFI